MSAWSAVLPIVLYLSVFVLVLALTRRRWGHILRTQ